MIQLLKMIGPILDGFKKIQVLSPNQCPEILLKSSEDKRFQKLQTYLSETGFSTKSNSFLVKKNDFDNQETLHKYILIQEYKKQISMKKQFLPTQFSLIILLLCKLQFSSTKNLLFGLP